MPPATITLVSFWAALALVRWCWPPWYQRYLRLSSGFVAVGWVRSPLPGRRWSQLCPRGGRPRRPPAEPAVAHFLPRFPRSPGCPGDGWRRTAVLAPSLVACLVGVEGLVVGVAQRSSCAPLSRRRKATTRRPGAISAVVRGLSQVA